NLLSRSEMPTPGTYLNNTYRCDPFAAPQPTLSSQDRNLPRSTNQTVNLLPNYLHPIPTNHHLSRPRQIPHPKQTPPLSPRFPGGRHPRKRRKHLNPAPNTLQINLVLKRK